MPECQVHLVHLEVWRSRRCLPGQLAWGVPGVPRGPQSQAVGPLAWQTTWQTRETHLAACTVSLVCLVGVATISSSARMLAFRHPDIRDITGAGVRKTGAFIIIIIKFVHNNYTISERAIFSKAFA